MKCRPSALAVVDLIWTDTTGAGVPGSAFIGVAPGDFVTLTIPDFGTTVSGETDLDCDGIVSDTGFEVFERKFNGAPDPSGLGCAGTVPCP